VASTDTKGWHDSRIEKQTDATMQELISGYVLLKSLVAIAAAAAPIMQEALISRYILL
jgi:hypothetical protein